MKRIFMMLSLVVWASLLIGQEAMAQNKTDQWPGVTIKVLVDNEKVNISELTFAPGAVADWHSHPQYTIYAVTDIKMQVEVKGNEPAIAELKKGEARWSAPVTHKATNIGSSPFTIIVTEIK